VPERRRPVPLDRLVWAALIAYPRYVDPVTGLPCTPELAVERLATGAAPRRGPVLRLLQLRARLLGRRAG